ncbi:heavy-metal-associated domain-containing protein [Desertivirga brevis]|uniref:heavy-metal-associated domain-containing protein n=1 Tax=Desertivirga brevis TaxID=2810310 RepID=UPI001A978D4A|nr:heavy metal-associated domain-containing protein [Pedobacter sp. SYSU D00873]
METLKFKTNIKCMGCISTVTPVLNEKAGVDKWKVDLQDPEKTLVIEGDSKPEEIVEALKGVGFNAERI